MTFKVGDKVQWRSQAGGVWKDKVGEIVLVVPAGTPPSRLFNRIPDLSGYRKPSGMGLLRQAESYLVAVKPTEKSKPQIYWPLVNQLKLAEPETEKGPAVEDHRPSSL